LRLLFSCSAQIHFNFGFCIRIASRAETRAELWKKVSGRIRAQNAKSLINGHLFHF